MSKQSPKAITYDKELYNIFSIVFTVENCNMPIKICSFLVVHNYIILALIATVDYMSYVLRFVYQYSVVYYLRYMANINLSIAKVTSLLHVD